MSRNSVAVTHKHDGIVKSLLFCCLVSLVNILAKIHEIRCVFQRKHSANFTQNVHRQSDDYCPISAVTAPTIGMIFSLGTEIAIFIFSKKLRQVKISPCFYSLFLSVPFFRFVKCFLSERAGADNRFDQVL